MALCAQTVGGDLMDMSMFKESDLQALDRFIDTFEDKESHLIAILHKAQDVFGYLPMELQVHIAKKTGIPTSKIYGVVTFYSLFTMKPRGKHTISVCMGTACFVKGAERVLEAIERELGIALGEMTEDGMFMLEQVHCLGACSLAPVISIDGTVYGHVTPEKVKGILDGYYIVEQGEEAHDAETELV